MTVKELIEKLQDAPQDAVVCVNNSRGRAAVQSVRIEPQDGNTLVILTD